MEEGLYEVNVHTLEVTERIKDGNTQPAIGDGIRSELPGYHGKGLYSGQETLVYANNGEESGAARRDPFVPSAPSPVGKARATGIWFVATSLPKSPAPAASTETGISIMIRCGPSAGMIARSF